MNKLILILISCFAFACGGEPDTGDTHQDLEREALFARGEPLWNIDGNDLDSDVEEKNLVVDGYGIDNTSSEAGANRCTTPHPLGTFCFVPHDKKVRFKYTGPNDSSLPFSAKVSFDNSILNFCGDLNEAGFDCASTTGSSNEPVAIAPLGGTSLGEARQTDCGTHTGDIVVHPGQGPDKKCHACTITLDKNKIGIGRTPDRANIAMTNVYYHEEAHCQALGHLSRPGYIMNPNLQSDTQILFMDTPDFEKFQNYQP